MMTPEQYFEQHPYVAVLARQTDGYDYYCRPTEHALGGFYVAATDINWTGYDRKVAYNPHFRWGKRREIEWTGKTTNDQAEPDWNADRLRMVHSEAQRRSQRRKVRTMRKRLVVFFGIVKPAFWIVLAAGQWGPEYAARDDGRVWDVIIRFVLSMVFACFAVRSLMSNNKQITEQTNERKPE